MNGDLASELAGIMFTWSQSAESLHSAEAAARSLVILLLPVSVIKLRVRFDLEII